MTPLSVLLIALVYVGVLLGIAQWSSRNASATNSESRFFVAGQNAPWHVVAFGMVGASLSGVTFLSIPGWVRDQEWTYMQMVFGYCIGYVLVAAILLPLYYKLKLTSIYGFLGGEVWLGSTQNGRSFFLDQQGHWRLVSTFLVALVIDVLVLEPLFGGITPWWWFGLTTAAILAVIYLYTRKSGMGTVIWTDTLQTACMLLAVVLTIGGILNAGHSWSALPDVVASTDLTQVWVMDDWRLNNHWLKHILAGMFVTIAMTGLDQDMMQKNLACRNLREAQWNMATFTVILVGANVLFLTMGSLLWMHAETIGMALPEATDRLYPMVAMGGSLGPVLGVAFVVGLLASAFSSADSALTALTTSTCIDVLDTPRMSVERAKSVRQRVHLGMAVLLWLVIMVFRAVNDTSVVAALFTVANYTYGPLLGLFGVGMFSKMEPQRLTHPSCLRGFALCRLCAGTSCGFLVGVQLWLCLVACQRAHHSNRVGLDFPDPAFLNVLSTA